MIETEPTSPPLKKRWQAHQERLFVAATLVVLVGLWVMQGTRLSPDSRTFASWAATINESGYIAHFSQGSSTAPPVFYTGFISLVALSQRLGGEDWGNLIVVINILALGAMAVVLTRLLSRLRPETSAPWLGFVFFLACFDLLQWVRYALSDITFLSLVLAILAYLCRLFYQAEEDAPIKKRSVCLLLFLTLLATFYRPTGLLLWPCVLFGLFLLYRLRSRQPLPSALKLGAGGLLLVVLAIAANAALMAYPENFGKLGIAKMVKHQIRHYETGEHVGSRSPKLSL